jgi:Effector Associated Constant Component 1
VEVELSVVGGPAAMRSLEAWLVGRDELRGRVRSVPAAPSPGAMGSLPDVLMVAVGQGGVVATAAASVWISWIRRQSGKVSVTAKRPDGAEITLTADHVRGLTGEEIPPLVTRLAAVLEGHSAEESDSSGAGE